MKIYNTLLVFAIFALSCGEQKDKRIQEVADCQCNTYKTILAKTEGQANASAIVLEEMKNIIQCISPFLENIKTNTPKEMEQFFLSIENTVAAQCPTEKEKITQFNNWE